MATVERSRSETHEVTNQAPPLEGHNSFSSDRVLVEAVNREGGEWAAERAVELGEICGRPETIRLGSRRTRTRRGCAPTTASATASTRSSSIPPGTSCCGLGVSHGLHALPWREPEPGAHVARGAMFMLLGQVEAGVGCPISMTYSAIPALRVQPELAAEWEPRFISLRYDGERAAAGGRQGGRAVRDGDDREAGRLGRSRQHDHGDPAQRRRARGRVRADRPQVVLLGADVRRVPRPRPGRGRALVLLAAPLHSRRRAQPDPHPAAQGQARQPLERVQRGRVPRRLGAADRRGGPRGADDHRDGQPHPARLRARRGRRDARRRRPCDPPRPAPLDLRQAARPSSR